MSESSDANQTPMATPRKRLGMRRIMPASAPKTVLSSSSSTPQECAGPSTQRDIKSRLGSYSAPRTLSSTSTTASEGKVNNENDSTPIARKRKSDTVQPQCYVKVKKLHFTDPPSAQSTKQEAVDTKQEAAASKKPPLFTEGQTIKEKIRSLKEDNEAKKNELERIKKHEKDVNQLKDSVKQWKDGATEALKQLKSKLGTPQSVTSILNHLQIPLDMFDMDEFSDDDDANT